MSWPVLSCHVMLCFVARKKREELLKNENDKFAEKLRLQAKIHQKSRSTNYPTVGNSVRRFVVPDDKVSWNVSLRYKEL